ncbi:MAG: YggT family protein [Candidatus Melainabacteria bacterium HGW-Melainabacteria-1]|nr:MAG: YggT family protein [Candidatus Melainabacteria bacterium HGW-Melainabacteria-1]
MQVVVFLYALERLIWFLILARIVVSFLPNIDPGHPIVRFIHQATEPILAPIRAILPSTRMGIDFSPMVAMFLISIGFRLLVALLTGA